MGRGSGHRLVALLLALAAGAMFWIPSLPVGRGWFPAPLDDVYIHFDYARAIGQGHPFEWIAGQGYSSGETAPLYAFLLAIGWIFGLRGPLLGGWAAVLAVLGVASLLGSLRRLLAPGPGWLCWLLALLPLSIGIVDWTLFSGMEVAIFAAAIGRALEALAATRRRSPHTRESLQWRLGAWGIALVLLRPESVVIIAIFAVLAARGVGRRSGFFAVGRASLPGAIATGLVALANRVFTGDARSAGAELKLISSNPYITDVESARIFVENTITLWIKALRGELAALPALVFVLPLLAVLALFTRRRLIASACLFSALAWIAIVTLNGNAPYHNFRYYVPGLLLIAIAAACFIASLPKWWATGLGILAIAVGAPKIPGQVRFFRGASANIRDQHVELGLRLAALPPDSIVLVGDAGAMPYVSGLTAVDALGLGGYHRRPFVRAAVQGESSVLELIEALPANQRPTHFALYPNWFDGLSSTFGHEIDRVTIRDNVIAGGPTKVLYRADWHAMKTEPSADELDIADVESEARYGYRSPAPNGGFTSFKIIAGEFDGGRYIPDGQTESFLYRGGAAEVRLRIRIDAGAREILANGQPMEVEPPVANRWRAATATLSGVRDGERVTLTARGGAYRDYHVWFERVSAASSALPSSR